MNYPKVKVTKAPGYADFEGELLVSSDDYPFVVVGFEWEGKKDAAVVPRECITSLEDAVNGPRWRVMKGDELIGRAEQWSNDRNVINPEDPKSVHDWGYVAMGSEWSHTGSQELREVEPGVQAVYAIREPWDRMAGYKHEDTGIRIVDAWRHGQ